ncbi:MAG TPA: hypothetical protein VE974_23770 [Thermoanaerobaculia bacterium]|nr:hypothetical protein [Thermoanaerobaculia bacterium]
MVDPGPSFGFHAPILPDLESTFWRHFELGCEVPFMKAVGAAPRETPAGGRLYVHSAEGMTARLFVDKNDIPLRVEMLKGQEPFITLVYSVFEQLLDAPKDLFEKPSGVKFEERHQ